MNEPTEMPSVLDQLREAKQHLANGHADFVEILLGIIIERIELADMPAEALAARDLLRLASEQHQQAVLATQELYGEAQSRLELAQQAERKAIVAGEQAMAILARTRRILEGVPGVADELSQLLAVELDQVPTPKDRKRLN